MPTQSHFHGKFTEEIILGATGRHEGSHWSQPGQLNKDEVQLDNFLLQQSYPPSWLIQFFWTSVMLSILSLTGPFWINRPADSRINPSCHGWAPGSPVHKALCGTSGWWPATTGIPHSSTAGPVLFKVLINNLDAGLKSIWSKFGQWYSIGRSCWPPPRQRGPAEKPRQIRGMGNHQLYEDQQSTRFCT